MIEKTVSIITERDDLTPYELDRIRDLEADIARLDALTAAHDLLDELNHHDDGTVTWAKRSDAHVTYGTTPARPL